jgi:hypothetical protein
MGRRVSDRFTVPICRLHHRELHRRGNERAWWQKQGINPLVIAASLWTKTHAATPMTGLADDIDRSANINGSDFGAVVRLQNNETNPNLRPEAK